MKRTKKMKRLRKKTRRGGMTPLAIAGISAGVLALVGAVYGLKGQSEPDTVNGNGKNLPISSDAYNTRDSVSDYGSAHGSIYDTPRNSFSF